MSKQSRFADLRMMLIYVLMSGIPKIIARIELNLPVCLLIISFEIFMMVLVGLMSGPENHSCKGVYAWLVFLDGLML
jgi:hypothetical protein